MGAYAWRGFYPAQFNTPLGSAIVAPGQVVEWPDGPPNEGHAWEETDDKPTPFEELGPQDTPEEESAADTQDESEKDSGENMPENIPAPTDTSSPAGDEKPADSESPQVTDTGDATDQPDQPDSAPAPSKRPTRANR